jgi:phosphoglycerate dehydrogenase-like enzyme
MGRCNLGAPRHDSSTRLAWHPSASHPPPAALSEGRIRGAALDVFATEPLPADSPLWGLPNVLLSPHCADRTKEFQFESLERFVENAKLYVEGKELIAVCDKRSGY